MNSAHDVFELKNSLKLKLHILSIYNHSYNHISFAKLCSFTERVYLLYNIVQALVKYVLVCKTECSFTKCSLPLGIVSMSVATETIYIQW